MSLSKTQIFLFFESGNYVKATRRLPQASSLSCLHRFIIIFINGAVCIIVLKLRIVPIVLVIVHIICIRIRLCRFLCLLLFLDFLEYEESAATGKHNQSKKCREHIRGFRLFLWSGFCNFRNRFNRFRLCFLNRLGEYKYLLQRYAYIR